MAEAGCSLIGGHSVADDEIKFGYAVTGTVHPDRIWTNTGARAGDALFFTKQLGTGVIATALKKGIADPAHVETSTASMLRLNRTACEIMLRYDVHGCTDVSGFGLLGHARELAAGSNVTLEIKLSKLEFLPGALQYAEADAVPGGARNNREFVKPSVTARVEVAAAIEWLLYDPQTSGGLLFTLPENEAAKLMDELPSAQRIGRVVAPGNFAICLL